MSIRELAQLDCREAFDTIDEATEYIDDNSFLALYLDGLAGDDDSDDCDNN